MPPKRQAANTGAASGRGNEPAKRTRTTKSVATPATTKMPGPGRRGANSNVPGTAPSASAAPPPPAPLGAAGSQNGDPPRTYRTFFESLGSGVRGITGGADAGARPSSSTVDAEGFEESVTVATPAKRGMVGAGFTPINGAGNAPSAPNGSGMGNGSSNLRPTAGAMREANANVVAPSPNPKVMGSQPVHAPAQTHVVVPESPDARPPAGRDAHAYHHPVSRSALVISPTPDAEAPQGTYRTPSYPPSYPPSSYTSPEARTHAQAPSPHPQSHPHPPHAHAHSTSPARSFSQALSYRDRQGDDGGDGGDAVDAMVGVEQASKDIANFADSLHRLGSLLEAAVETLPPRAIEGLGQDICHDWRVDEMATFVEGYLRGAGVKVGQGARMP